MVLDKLESDIPKIGFLRLEKVLLHIPVGKSTWWAGVASGKFPQPVKLGPRTTAWRAQDILDLIETLESGGAFSG